MKETLLQGRALRKVFSQNGVSTAILDGIDIVINEHDFTVIMGPSGAGKSTLLYALSGMDRITGGEITYNGKKSAASRRIRWHTCGAGSSVLYSSRLIW